VARGGYILAEADKPTPDVILVATGSEVALCVAAREELAKSGISARVVSMPCWELFEAQDDAYKSQVFPESVTARVGVELGVQQGWERYLGLKGRFIGMSGFGASAPDKVLMQKFGFTVEHVVSEARKAAGKS
jgi:transketolase